jgi:hypothetical protein
VNIGTRSILFGVHQFAIHPWFVAWAWRRLYGFPWDPRLWVAFFVHDLGYWGTPNMDGSEGERHPKFGARVMALFDRGPKTIPGRWESVLDSDGEMCRVRWSLRDAEGRYLWVSHYPGTLWGQNACERNTDRWNQEKKSPWEWPDCKGVPMHLRNKPWHDLCLYHSRFLAYHAGMPYSRLCVADKLAIALTPAWLYLPLARLSGELREYMKGKGARTPAGDRSPRQWYRDLRRYCEAWALEHHDGRPDEWTGTKRDLAIDEQPERSERR